MTRMSVKTFLCVANSLLKLISHLFLRYVLVYMQVKSSITKSTKTLKTNPTLVKSQHKIRLFIRQTVPFNR